VRQYKEQEQARPQDDAEGITIDAVGITVNSPGFQSWVSVVPQIAS